MRTALARLLVLLLVPVVLVAGLARPAAAISYGPIAPWSASWGAALVSGVSCNFNAQWTLDGPTNGILGQGVRTSATCKFGAWTTGLDSNYDVQLDYHGTSVEDPSKPCGMSTGFRDEMNIKGSWYLNATQGTHYADGTTDPPTVRCKVDQVCYKFVRDARFTSDDGKTACTTAGPGGAGGIVGAPPADGPPPSPTCQYGTVSKPTTIGQPQWTKISTTSGWRWNLPYTSTVSTPSGGPLTRWLSYVVVKMPSGRTAAFYGGASNPPILDPTKSTVVPVVTNVFPTSTRTDVNAGTTANLTTTAFLSDEGNSGGTNPGQVPIDGAVIGAGVVGWPWLSSTNTGWSSRTTGTGSRALPTPGTIQMDPAFGAVGVNEPSRCHFYWGARISDDGNSVTIFDNPAGDLGETPPPGTADPSPDPEAPTGGDDDECGFSVTDPSTWAGGGICALVGLIGGLIDVAKDIVGGLVDLFGVAGQILAKIGGLVGDLVRQLTDLFVLLFVPNPSSWDLGSMIDDLKVRPPFSLMTDLLDVAGTFTGSFSSAGGCTNLINFGDGMNVSCASVKNTPGFALGYGLLSVAMWACTGIACFRMFTSNFGDQS